MIHPPAARTDLDPLRLRLLGVAAWRVLDGPWHALARCDAALLARLALEGPLPRSMLACWLWSDAEAPRAHANLRQRLYRLRKVCGVALVAETPDGLRLGDAVACDIGREACAADADLQAPLLDGLPCADDPVQHWLDEERCRWQARRGARIAERASACEDAGDLSAAVRFVEDWLGFEPLSELAWRRLMQLHARQGDRAAAVASFERCEQVLRAELGLRPSPQTIALLQEIEDGRVAAAAAPSGSATAGWRLPPCPPLLVGRDEALAALRQRLGIGAAPGVARPLTVMHGWPGVGKSTTLAWLAHLPEVQQSFPDGVLWTSLGESPSVATELGHWVRALGLPEVQAATDAARLDELTSRLCAALGSRRMLLLVDDAWQLAHARLFCVGGRSCATLVSTRLPDLATALAPAAADVYRLPLLSQQDGVRLLGSLTPETVEQHPAAARALVDDLEGLPLALHVAGRLLATEARMGWGVDELLRELRDGAALLGAQAPHDMHGAGPDTSSTVQALLRRSTDGLEPALRTRFALLGLFVPKPASFDLPALAALWDSADPRPVVRRLVNHGLLEPMPGGRFQLHALLVMHARALLSAGDGG